MRTLTYTAFVSLDGVVDSPGGGSSETHRAAGWTYKDIEFLEEAYELKGREMGEATALMLGRKSYEAFAPVWPGMAEFASYKEMPKYVVSSTLDDDDLVDNWGETTILRSLDEVAKIKEAEGGAIFIHGSASLARNLADADLLDRYYLLVFPVLLGAGKRMFSDANEKQQPLKLVESESYSNGIQKLVYEFVR